MNTKRCLLFLLLIAACAASAGAQTQKVTVSGPLTAIPGNAWDSNVAPNIVQATAQIRDAEGAEAIISGLLRPDPRADTKKSDFYCVFHVLRWASPAAGTAPTVQAQNWYVYHKGKLSPPGKSSESLRIFGAKRLTFLYLHLNSDNNYEPLYEFEIVKKTPAYLNRLLGLAGLYNSLTSPAAAAAGARARDFFGSKTFDVNYRPSDITATAKIIKPTQEVVDLSSTQKFDNEGLYFLDFSVGVPVRRMSELNFDATNNVITANKVDKQNVFAFVNVYPRPVDIKNNGVDFVPHFVGGVAMAKKPLDKIFVGTGFGPVFANFYIGALFVKQDQLNSLKPGDPATPAQLGNDLRRRYKTQVGFGLNLPVGAVIEKLKK